MDKPTISVDLLQAARRSESFPKDWTEEKTLRAIDRYRKFLHLVAQDPNRPVAPTREIDVIWHLHMLSPRALRGLPAPIRDHPRSRRRFRNRGAGDSDPEGHIRGNREGLADAGDAIRLAESCARGRLSKFQPCLPPRLEAELLAETLTDDAAARAVLVDD